MKRFIRFLKRLFGKEEKKEVVMKDETYWHSKHPQVMQMYHGRPLPNGNSFEIDVRRFIWVDDITMLFEVSECSLKKEDPDDTALAVQRHVVKLLKYISDENLGCPEYWLFPTETLEMRHGDCEDGAILIASLLLNALPEHEHWRVRVACGIVQESPTAPEGGHAYVEYCRKTDGEWVILDWCYLEDSHIPVNQKPKSKDVPCYKNVWFSFNDKFAYSHVDFKMSGRLRNESK